MFAQISSRFAPALALAACAAACSGAISSGSTSDIGTSSTEQALTTVVDCQTQAGTCLGGAKTPADANTCNDAFRTCLLGVAQASGISLPSFDGGVTSLPTPPTLPTLPGAADGGFPTLPTKPTLPNFDGGLPTLPTPGLPTLPGLDGGAPTLPGAQGCVFTLNTCVTGGTAPATCGAQAQTCLKAERNSECDAEYQQCTTAKLPNCDALKTACTVP